MSMYENENGDCEPRMVLAGRWLCLYRPKDLPPTLVRRALTALYRKGYRSLAEIMLATDEELIRVENVGPQNLSALRAFLELGNHE